MNTQPTEEIKMLKQSILAIGLVLTRTMAAASGSTRYEVTITNITPGQTFTPQLVLTHDRGFSLFSLGEPATVFMSWAMLMTTDSKCWDQKFMTGGTLLPESLSNA
ncbi:MAG: hypothetical protein ACI9JM_000375 [Halioglobus sp.]